MKLALLITISIVTLSGCVTNQGTPTAITTHKSNTWDGHYRLTWMEDSPAAEGGASDEELSITRTPDADPAEVDEKLKTDLARWTLSSDEDDIGELRRFLPTEYEEWGWTSLYTTGAIECLVSSHFFVCRVEPGTTVIFEGSVQEKILARTGLFGVALHAGGFELTKLDSPQ
jgi:hypothetical protein